MFWLAKHSLSDLTVCRTLLLSFFRGLHLVLLIPLSWVAAWTVALSCGSQAVCLSCGCLVFVCWRGFCMLGKAFDSHYCSFGLLFLVGSQRGDYLSLLSVRILLYNMRGISFKSLHDQRWLSGQYWGRRFEISPPGHLLHLQPHLSAASPFMKTICIIVSSIREVKYQNILT